MEKFAAVLDASAVELAVLRSTQNTGSSEPAGDAAVPWKMTRNFAAIVTELPKLTVSELKTVFAPDPFVTVAFAMAWRA